MRKIGVCVLAIVMFITNVKAASKCSYAEEVELNELAGKIKLIYEEKKELVKDGTTNDKDYYKDYFDILITNITYKFYVIVESDIDNVKHTYSSADAKNNIISFKQDDLVSIVHYTVNVYSSNNTGCKDEIYKTLYLTTPRYNPYSQRSICDGKEEYSLCNKYVETEEISETDFLNRIEKEMSSRNKNDKNDNKIVENNNTIIDILKEYKYYVIGALGFIIIIGVLVVIAKSKKRKELGL